MKIAVCITTYKRPEGLRRLLSGLNELSFDKCAPPLLKVVVVDNDAAGSASAVCEDVRAWFRWPLEYHIEPQRGISQARNRAVARAAALDTDFLAFVDDDQAPEPSWLDELLFVQRSYVADVVGGPSLPYFYEPVPDWVIKGKFFEQSFERPRYPTGHLLKLTAAGNVLIRTKVFEEMGEYFNEELGLTGGEDTLFFANVYEAGYKLVWANEAVVYEWTPASRANVRWILRRAYRLGNSRSLYETHAGAGPTVRIVRIAKGGGRIVQGLLLLLLSVPLSFIVGRQPIMKALVLACRGAGMLAGMLRIRHEEYR